VSSRSGRGKLGPRLVPGKTGNAEGSGKKDAEVITPRRERKQYTEKGGGQMSKESQKEKIQRKGIRAKTVVAAEIPTPGMPSDH